MVECDSELSTTSIKPVQNKVVTQALNNKVDKVSGKQLSTEDFTTSLKNKLVGLKEFDPAEINNEIDTLAKQVNTKQNKLVSGTSIKTINGESILGNGNINVAPEITVDSTLSSTSTNPIQNKVVSIALDNKVAKVTGKGLSTEDFTTKLKTKLEGLTNYDDTAIRNAVNGLTTQLNTLVNGDASVAIESFNEIITFLNGVEDSESLDSIIASIEQQIAGKQDKLVNGTNIKTINGESILGEGNIVVNVDTSNLATKEELIEVEEVHAAALNDLNDRIGAIEENVSGSTVSKEEFESTVTSINESITGKADTTYVDEELAKKADITYVDVKFGNIDFSTLATKEEVQNLTNEIIDNEEVHAAALNDLEERKADKEYVEDALGNVDLSAKQDKIDDLDAIRSGAALGATAIQQVKTINGEEIEGEGNIEIKADVDTSTLVTKEEFTDVEEVWAASYNLLNQKISDVQQYIYDEAASRRQFDEAIAEIQSIIAENESVVTAAWNQLNTRINALEAAQRG